MDDKKKSRPSAVRIVLIAITVLLILTGIFLLVMEKTAGLAVVLVGILLCTRNIGTRRK